MPHRNVGLEFARLASLYRYGVIGSAADPAIDMIVRRLAQRLDVPVAQLVFADAQHVLAKSSIGPVDTCHLRVNGPFQALLDGGAEFVTLSSDTASLPRSAVALQSLAALRILSAEEEVIGALYVADTSLRSFTSETREALTVAVAEIRVMIESLRRGREDETTGALRRDAFLDQTRRLIEVSRIGRHWVSLVTLDLQPLRAGLEAKAAGLGSLATRHMAELGRAQVRRRDSFGHLGDDLFAILLTNTGEAGARVLAKRLSAHLEKGWTDAGLTASSIGLGIASLKPVTGQDAFRTLVERATVGSRLPPSTIEAVAQVA